MDALKTQHLLTKVSAINKKFESIAEITGENFNVFKILKVGTKEVRLHSAFITELLNPKGSHGQGDVFLKLFIEVVNNSATSVEQKDDQSEDKYKKINKFNTNTAEANKEKNIGLINDDYTEGGRIDIVIESKYLDNGQAIIIENKIDAKDEKHQLLRYFNYKKGKNVDYYLFYLTLKGTDPSILSTGEGLTKNEHYANLSYEKDILIWLMKCQKEAVKLPILRETIEQYINLIKHLTGQTRYHKMDHEIVTEITKTSDGVDAAFGIINTKHALFSAIETRFITSIIEEGPETLKMEKQKDRTDCFYWVYSERWKYKISIQFHDNHEKMRLGVSYKNESDQNHKLNDAARQNLSNLNIGKPTDNKELLWDIEYEEWANTSWGQIWDLKLTPKVRTAIDDILKILECCELKTPQL